MTDPLLAGLAVAVVSLLAVIGPLLHLSPWLISLLVVLMLGSLTVDAARFGGRGGHLLAETLPGGLARLRRIAVHESGHVLVAEAESMPVRQVLVGSLACLREGLRSNGSTQLDPPAAAKLPLSELRRWSRVLQAGMVAEQLQYGSAIGGADDRALLGQLWGLSGYDVATAQREQRQARRDVQQLLKSHQPQMLAQVERLLAAAPRLGRPEPVQDP
ncbi:MAG: hypothetical protein FJ077_12370 [Cyanobacteria bacterium K_DeepCast_35m_m2_023]|nr:hypothetical protein [Cyanobacteria bacterium K_DeepCast_35m_m2_023]